MVAIAGCELIKVIFMNVLLFSIDLTNYLF